MNRAPRNMLFILQTRTIWRCICASILLVAAMSTTAIAEVSLELALDQERVYTGEAVPVTVILRIGDETVRNIGYPRLVAPGGGTVAFTPPVQDTDAKDQRITLYKFTGRISGVVKPGWVTIGPVNLSCEVMQPASGSAAFFGGQEPRSIKLVSATSPLEILPLPATGKPGSFSGAIGSFSMSVKTVPSQVAVGEPVTITTTISGAGSLARADCPNLVDPSMQSLPVKATRSETRLTCEQVVMPHKAMQFPAVIWSYFDPRAGVYRVLSGDVKSRVTAHTQPPIAKTVLLAHPEIDTQNPVSTIRYFLMAMAGLVLLSALALLMRTRFKQSPVTMVSEPSSELQGMLRDAEDAASNGDIEQFYNITFAIIQECVEKPYNKPVSAPSVFQQSSNLPIRDEKPYNINEVREIIVACDKVRYGHIMPDKIAMTADLEKIKQLFSNTL
jgi:hypothetical protein